MSGLVDTHCHLDSAEFNADRSAMLHAAYDVGISAIVVPSVSRNNFDSVYRLCRHHPTCAPAYGIHPMNVSEATPQDLQHLRKVLTDKQPVAMGEIGLDFFIKGYDAVRQNYYFCQQLKLAKDYDLPIILHSRRAVDAVLKQLRRIKVRGGIVHAFNGSRQQADIFIDLGFKLGFGGAMTYQRALHLRKLASSLPLESIVLETDSPDMPPAWINHQRNSPVELKRIAMELATLRSQPLAQIISATTVNAINVLPGLESIFRA